MVKSVSDFFSDLDFRDIFDIFFDNGYYEFLFPFLLAFAVMYTILSRVKIFQNKTTGKPFSSIIMVVSLVVSWYGISFETSEGYSVGKLLMMMFPNISALTIGILVLYIVGAILGKNFFKGLFDRKESSFIHMAIGGIGLGAILYYVGIAMGFWDFNPWDQNSYWNFILALFLLILGVVFIVVDLIPIGVLFLTIFGAYIYNSQDGNILEYFIDPVIFVIVIVVLLLSWLNSDKDKRKQLEDTLRGQEKTISDYHKEYGRKPKNYESKIYDIVEPNYENNKKQWEKLTGNKWN